MRKEYPVMVGKAAYFSGQKEELKSEIEDKTINISIATGITFSKILRKAKGVVEEINSISDDEWFDIFYRSGEAFWGADENDREELSEAMEICKCLCGLPIERVRTSLETLQEDLVGAKSIVSSQLYGMPVSSIKNYETGKNFALVPCGSHLLINVPGNSPTIHINWLIPLMMRRPVIIVASKEDPLIPLYLVHLLYKNGLPDGAVSLVYQLDQGLYSKADQVMWSGTVPARIMQTCSSVKSYHQGRSKLVIDGDSLVCDLIQRLFRSATMGSGRLCTNISGVLVNDSLVLDKVSRDLAVRFNKLTPGSLDCSKTLMPAFPSKELAEAANLFIERIIHKGAIDLTLRLGNHEERLEEVNGVYFVRPTVLVVPEGIGEFGAELPFPFVMFMNGDRDGAVKICAGSLIVSLLTNDQRYILDFLQAPSINKLCVNESFDRGYSSHDPHQGFISDFLFFKKAFHESV